jgi:hypothetical protein
VKCPFRLFRTSNAAQTLAPWRGQRDAQNRIRLVARGRIDLACDFVFSEPPPDPPRLARLHHLPHDPHVVADAELPPFHPQGRATHKLFVGPIPQKNARAIRLQQRRGRLGHRVQKGLHAMGLTPRLRDLQNRLQATDPTLALHPGLHSMHPEG